MIKKVLFVRLWDVITIPSQKERPMDITDFQVRFDFVKALQRNKDICRVNIFGYDKAMIMYANDEDFAKMVSAICYEITQYSGVASIGYSSMESEENVLLDSFGSTERVEIFKDKDCWLMVGSEKLADTFGIDCVSKYDFCNDATDGDTDGYEGRDEEQTDKTGDSESRQDKE